MSLSALLDLLHRVFTALFAPLAAVFDLPATGHAVTEVIDTAAWVARGVVVVLLLLLVTAAARFLQVLFALVRLLVTGRTAGTGRSGSTR